MLFRSINYPGASCVPSIAKNPLTMAANLNLSKSNINRVSQNSVTAVSETGDNNLISGFHEKGYSEETARMIDSEIKGFLDIAYRRANEILREHYDKLKMIAEMLMEFETLERDDLDKIMDGSFDSKEKQDKLDTFQNANKKSPPPLPSSVLKRSRKRSLTDQPKPI